MMWVIILIGIIILVVIGATIIFLHNRNHTTTAKKVKDIGELMNKYKNKQELTNADYRDIIVTLYEDNLNNQRTTRNNLKRIRKLQDVSTDTRLLATSNKDTIQKEKEIARANYDANKALIDTNKTLIVENEDTIQKEKEIARANYDANKGLINHLNKQSNIHGRLIAENKSTAETKHNKLQKRMNTIGDRVEGAASGLKKMTDFGVLDEINNLKGTIGDVKTNKQSIRDFKQSVGQLETNFGQIRSNVGQLGTRVGQLGTRVGQIGTRVDQLESSKATKREVGDMRNNLTTAMNDAIAARYDDYKKFVDQRHSSLDKRFDIVESEIDNLGNNMDFARSTDLNELKQTMDDISEEIGGYKLSTLGELSQQVQDIQDERVAEEQRYSNLEDALNTHLHNRLDEQIGILQSNINNNAAAISNINQQNFIKQGDTIGGLLVTDNGPILSELLDDKANRSALSNYLTTDYGISNDNNVTNMLGQLSSFDARIASNTTNLSKIVNPMELDGIDDGKTMYSLLDDRITSNSNNLDSRFRTLRNHVPTQDESEASGISPGSPDWVNLINRVEQNSADISKISKDIGGYDSRISSNTTNLSKIVDLDDLPLGIAGGKTMYSVLDERINSNSTYLDTQFGSLFDEEQWGNILNIANGSSGNSVDSSEFQSLRDDVDSNIAGLSNLSELLNKKADESALNNYLTTDYGTSNDNNVTNMLRRLTGFNTRIASNTTNLSKIVNQTELAGIAGGKTMYSLLDDRINSNSNNLDAQFGKLSNDWDNILQSATKGTPGLDSTKLREVESGLSNLKITVDNNSNAISGISEDIGDFKYSNFQDLETQVDENKNSISNINNKNYITQGQNIGGLKVNGSKLSNVLNNKANRRELDNYLHKTNDTIGNMLVTTGEPKLSDKLSSKATKNELNKIANKQQRNNFKGTTMYGSLNDRINNIDDVSELINQVSENKDKINNINENVVKKGENNNALHIKVGTTPLDDVLSNKANRGELDNYLHKKNDYIGGLKVYNNINKNLNQILGTKANKVKFFKNNYIDLPTILKSVNNSIYNINENVVKKGENNNALHIKVGTTPLDDVLSNKANTEHKHGSVNNPSQIQRPKIQMPKIQMPKIQMPKIQMPKIQMPKIQRP
jgi:hypothetical protein